MKGWLWPTLGAILCWGGWAFLPKLSNQYIGAKSAIAYQGLGGAILATLIFANLGDRLETHPQGAILAIIAGMLNFLGVLFYIQAVSKGSVSVVAPLSALYPLVVIILAVAILQETMTLKQAIAMGFALIAIALFAT
ncbi:MAG: DMT family transporter [Roseofilum sp. SBFL]|uniref:EamA family transporter n=1 Tax=unclassified Roseofilum TaxID=2620099 RepID=UPI001AFECB46|nr:MULTISPECIES: DMT family transporter [unclassified Roseofilum]MBP0015460.1 DMT family transporter [Roseofilum sp. SID3]MBP0023222.1 DMT family transporter [Roseofilum sp. SID2]MBP0039886.1 DMT family transporter [Roseofilum sp. SID1]MBP0041497.1 DMT family transporter [Roseofilum sp. SBFL]